MKLSSPSSPLACLALLLATRLGCTAASTQYACPSGSSCTLSSNGGICSPIPEGLPAGNSFSPFVQGQDSTLSIPYECIGISDADLESGGGSCIVKCPESCTITSGVENACSGSFDSALGLSTPTPPGPTPSFPPGPQFTDDFAYTQYVCPSGSSCTLSSKGGVCSPIPEGLPTLTNFMPTIINEGPNVNVPYECIGISGTDLESGGGSCIMTCPESCTITSNVEEPCSGSAHGSSPAALRAVSNLMVAVAGIGTVMQFVLI